MASVTRKEEIILATLDLAAEHGLRSVTLTQIAARMSMRKPSLYNHFSSKDEIVSEAYRYLRERARARSAIPVIDLDRLIAGKSLEETLLTLFEQYCSLVMDPDLLRLFKVLYAERPTNAAAAQIVLDETNHMVQQVSELFRVLASQGKMRCDDVDMAALSFAMTIHGLVDRQIDEMVARQPEGEDAQLASADARAFISWFARQMEVGHA